MTHVYESTPDTRQALKKELEQRLEPTVGAIAYSYAKAESNAALRDLARQSHAFAALVRTEYRHNPDHELYELADKLLKDTRAALAKVGGV